MKKIATIVSTVFAAMLVAVPAMAQAAPAGAGSGTIIPGAIGAGIVMIGAGLGIGKLAGSALEAMARQPEVAGAIQTAMIIAAALIEGATFFALYICMEQNPWG